MSGLQIVVLAIIQGLSEFLPVSSSAHLIVGSKLFAWPDQGLMFDVATHLGTLLAVVVYFRAELKEMIVAVLSNDTTAESVRSRRMVILLAAASVPVLLAGFLARDLIEHYVRDLRVIAWTTIVFGLALWLSDRLGGIEKRLVTLRLPDAIVIGLAQMLALIPGTSRSGVTITAGRLLGLDVDSAARFSFLLSLPVIGAAGAYGALRVATGEEAIDWHQFLLAVMLSAMTGWLCIAAFLALLRRVGLLPFVVYRLALGAVLLWLLY